MLIAREYYKQTEVLPRTAYQSPQLFMAASPPFGCPRTCTQLHIQVVSFHPHEPSFSERTITGTLSNRTFATSELLFPRRERHQGP